MNEPVQEVSAQVVPQESLSQDFPPQAVLYRTFGCYGSPMNRVFDFFVSPKGPRPTDDEIREWGPDALKRLREYPGLYGPHDINRLRDMRELVNALGNVYDVNVEPLPRFRLGEYRQQALSTSPPVSVVDIPGTSAGNVSKPP